jgi:predicted RND superfamily exporter protein
MKSFFALYGRFIGRRPIIALLLVGFLSLLAIFGLTLTAEQADESEAFLPDGSELIAAQRKLARNFPASSGLEAVQIVFRGDVLTPTGLDETRRLTTAAAEGDLAPFVT